jgi:DNA polymerase-3 subunit delta'
VSWNSIRGHEELVAAFREVVTRGRLGHAYLFVGPSGIGKKTFAVELAKALLCEANALAPSAPAGRGQNQAATSAIARGEGEGACGVCPACVQVEARTHPDFQLVGLPEDRHEFPIEEMQKLIAHLALKPARGRHRVAIVDDAESLSSEAANCFLKTLEEPPPDSLLILIATSAERLLPTIRSRCQLIRFAPLPPSVLADLILAEGLAEHAEAARRLAEASGGSLEQARWLAQPDVQQLQRQVDDLLRSRPVDCVVLGQTLSRFCEEGAKESAVKRERARLALGLLAELLRRRLSIAVGHQAAGPGSGRVPVGEVESLVDALDRVLVAEQQIDRWLQVPLVLEACAADVARRLE